MDKWLPCVAESTHPHFSPFFSNFTLQYMPLPLSDISQAYRSAPERTEQALTKVGAVGGVPFVFVFFYFFWKGVKSAYFLTFCIDPEGSGEEQPDSAFLPASGSSAASRPRHQHRRAGSCGV